MAKVGIIIFPGSNCDRDVFHVLNDVVKLPTEYLWHTTESIEKFDAIILPGGFSYGDRLRAGIIAAHSPIVKQIKKLSEKGLPVLGICNGFQILVECGLLPGALLMNRGLQFICKWTQIEVLNSGTPFTIKFKRGDIIDIPVAHGEGRYAIDDDTYREVNKNNQIVFKYKKDNFNGSIESIAGISNKCGNILGIMPHPERAAEEFLTPFGIQSNAVLIFYSLLEFLKMQDITKSKDVIY
jgi:phosphoribosylformylglycinamidine synthase